MEKEITLIFHNQGLRSYIEVDLCAECPRQDDKGCCGFYAPVFYPSDLAYLSLKQPELIAHIFSMDRLTILDHSVTVNNIPEGDSYRCRFHSKDGGCLLTQTSRESICRHFVCAGIGWEREKELVTWKNYFQELTDYENQLNQRLADALKERSLSLRDPALRDKYFQALLDLFRHETEQIPAFITNMPAQETFHFHRPLSYKQEWVL